MRLALGVIMIVGLAAFSPLAAGAADAGLWNACEVGSSVSNSTICQNTDDAEAGTFIQALMDVLLWVVGVLAVIMIIFGGIKYALSAGDPAKLTAAKNTIMYSVIGLIVAVFAYTIVTFIIDGLTK